VEVAARREMSVDAVNDGRHNRRIFARQVQGMSNLIEGLFTKGIAYFGPVDSDPGSIVASLINDFGLVQFWLLD
jgi:hypothetical protein